MYIIGWPVRHDFHTSLPSTGRRDTDKAAQRSSRCPIPGGVQGQVGWVPEPQPHPQQKKGTGCVSRSLQIQNVLWFFTGQFFFSGSQPTPKINGGTKKRRDTPCPGSCGPHACYLSFVFSHKRNYILLVPTSSPRAFIRWIPTRTWWGISNPHIILQSWHLSITTTNRL